MKTHDRLIQQVKNHVRGSNCACNAYGECECGCPDTDWRSHREVAATTAFIYLVKKLKAHHKTKPGISALVAQAEQIFNS